MNNLCSDGKEAKHSPMGQSFSGNRKKLEKLTELLKHHGITIFEYDVASETLILYDDTFENAQRIPQYFSYLKTSQTNIISEDQWKVRECLKGTLRGPIEIGIKTKDGEISRKVMDTTLVADEKEGDCLIGYFQEVTEAREREKVLEIQAKTDSLTGLYNHFSGKELIGQYLQGKDPYASCGLMVVDIDFFKNVNDTYGHLFGDKVLAELARLFKDLFDKKDVVMRAGGDEFVILLKDIGHATLLKKAALLTESVRKLSFSEQDYCLTCSVGVCFLPENVTGYTYDQLFENADWALYKAKEYGRNQYVFCDNLQRFELAEREKIHSSEIDVRYLHNDIVSTAFEIFEKSGSFDAAIDQLLKVIGIRMKLDRITVIRTDIKDQNTSRQFQWRSALAPEALAVKSGFTKEDFLTLFQSYDEYGTTVLQYDNMGMYSQGACDLLMQGEAKTVVYAAMYSEGKYTGAISYVVCTEKRYWSRQDRRKLGELTKIITAYFTRHQMVNNSAYARLTQPEYDQLTGLLSFSRFREEVEHKIIAGYADSYVMIYSDFENFKFFNQKYTYSSGDRILKEFANSVIETLPTDRETYFCRVVADQFVIFFPYTGEKDVVCYVQDINQEIIQKLEAEYPGVRLRIRSGIYEIRPDCLSASVAIDAANFARKQVKNGSPVSVCLYDELMAQRQRLQSELTNGMTQAMEQRKFRLYLQPKFSLEDFSVIGAEALVRLEGTEGNLLYPDQFISLYEENGRIEELDFYMFELAAEFLARCARLGYRLLPISVNASVLLAKNKDSADRYQNI